MRGAPKHFNTRQDVENCLTSSNPQLVQSAKDFLRTILTDRYCTAVIREITKDEDPSSFTLQEGQRLVEAGSDHHSTSKVTHHIVQTVEDVNAPIFQLGYTVEEVTNLLGE